MAADPEAIYESFLVQDLTSEWSSKVGGNTLVRYLTRAREQRGLTQTQVGERMGHAQCTVSKLERSKDADLNMEMIGKWSKALGLDLILTFGDKTGKGVY